MYAPGMGLGRPCWLLVHALIPARPPRCASRCRPKAMHLYQPDRRGALRATGPRTHTINVTPGTGGGRPVVPGAGIYKRPASRTARGIALGQHSNWLCAPPATKCEPLRGSAFPSASSPFSYTSFTPKGRAHPRLCPPSSPNAKNHPYLPTPHH